MPSESTRSRSDSSSTGEARSRRRFLQTTACASAALLAGCLDGSGGDGQPADEPEGNDSGDGNENPGNTDPGAGSGIDAEIPVTGTDVPALRPLDEAMIGYMTDLGVEGGALGVARNGEVVLRRGYGWADDPETTATPPDALVRIASISKTLTKAAVYELEASGRLSRADRALDHLPIEPPGGEPADERFAEVTVQQLLDHEGGLPRSRAPDDPVFRPRQVADALGLDAPPDSADFVRYLLDRPLAYEPGTDSRYSNSGYAVLGHVVAGAAGHPYQSYLEEAVLPAPEDIGIARTDPDERPPREVAYHSPATAPTALDLDSDREVPLPDGGFLVEMLGGAGGHYGSTSALLAFMDEYWVFFGQPRSASVPVEDPAALGSLPGSYAVAFHQGPVDVVALFNRRVPSRSEGILTRLRTAVEEIEEWPG
jgi:CubicO group peptidase (beta-lactamase class C family)